MKTQDNHYSLAELNELCRESGFTPSAAGWETADQVYACSVEAARLTNGHPLWESEVNYRTGWADLAGEIWRFDTGCGGIFTPRWNHVRGSMLKNVL